MRQMSQVEDSIQAVLAHHLLEGFQAEADDLIGVKVTTFRDLFHEFTDQISFARSSAARRMSRKIKPSLDCSRARVVSTASSPTDMRMT